MELWTRECLTERGMLGSSDPQNIQDQYLTNALLKINAKVPRLICFAAYYGITWLVSRKHERIGFFFLCANQLGGLNSQLKSEISRAIPLVVKDSNHYLRYGCFSWFTGAI
jgi:hypothetical protein